jgi:hypothetical protein
VIERCASYALEAANKGKPLIKPIKSKRCGNYIVIDLIDFRAIANSKHKWILQIKCLFSCYIWLYALKDKSAALVCEALVVWFSQNGLCKKLYVFFIILLS